MTAQKPAELLASPIDVGTAKEIQRIQRLFKERAGDAEDLISYAREIVGLRRRLAAAPCPGREAIEQAARYLDDLESGMLPGNAETPSQMAEKLRLRALGMAGVRLNPKALEALRSYRQADVDGIMATVSRQALDEAIAALANDLPAGHRTSEAK